MLLTVLVHTLTTVLWVDLPFLCHSSNSNKDSLPGGIKGTGGGEVSGGWMVVV